MSDQKKIKNAPSGAGGDLAGSVTRKRLVPTHQSPEGERDVPITPSDPTMVSASRAFDPSVDLRFSDSTVAFIVEAHRMHRRLMKARNGLILQGKAALRGLTDGDKDEANKIWDRVSKGKDTPDDARALIIATPFISAATVFDADMAGYSKQMVKAVKQLPIAPWVEGVRGLGWSSVAQIVGEAGDLSQYPSVAGVWKRLGLAVIDGGRQRKCADAEKALAHGYNPERRSVVWNMAEALAKLQRTWIDKETGEVKKPADPYGEYLEQEKAKQLAKGCTPMAAEQRAKRHMSKRILRDLTVEWRRAVGRGVSETQKIAADCAPYLMAAE